MIIYVSFYNLKIMENKLTRQFFRIIQAAFYGLTIQTLAFSLVLASGKAPEVSFQEIVVTGTVTSLEDDSPVPGVNVVLKETSKGTVTDVNGRYSISVSSGESVLVFSSIGFIREEVTVGTRAVIDIRLAPDIKQLQEVVVTALGISRETRSITYARQGVDVEKINEVKSPNIINSLSGKVAGVQITPPSQTTGSARIVIRGANSLTGNNQPLFVVDGVPINNEQGDANVRTSGNTSLDYGNTAVDINPADIESLEVLKGPNAAALYGSRAANGVILITTKKSSGTKFKVSLNSNVMLEQITQFPAYQDAYGVGDRVKLEGSNSTKNELRIPDVRVWYRSWGPPAMGQPIIGIDGEVKTLEPHPNNVRDFYQPARLITNTAIVEGGDAANNYRFSYTNYYGSSVVDNININNRNTLNLRVNNTFNKWLSLDSKVTYVKDNVRNRQYMNGSNLNPAYQYVYMTRSVTLDEYMDYKDANGNEIGTHRNFQNPYWTINENRNNDTRDRLLGAFNLQMNIFKWLKFNGKLGVDAYWWDGAEFNNKGAQSDPDGLMKSFNNISRNTNLEYLFSANKKLNKFSLDVYAGGSQYRSNSERRRQLINSLIIPDLENMSNSNEYPSISQVRYEKVINSVFGAATLGYNGYLYLDLTARNDWSSTLPASNNSYFYPSIGGSFLFTEALRGILPDQLTLGKLRASYAIVGNDTDPYRLKPTYSFDGIYNDVAYASLSSSFPNPDLKPEKTISYELGADFRLWEDRLGLDVTYYNSRTKNQIVQAQLASSSGFEERYYNAGEISNWGYELMLTGNPVETKNFSWNISANYSKNNSKVNSLIEGVESFKLNDWFNRAVVYAEVGQPYGVIRGRGWKRDDQGRRLVNSDGSVMIINDTLLGHAAPDWMAGINNAFRYKNFDFNVLFDFRWGGEFYSGTYKRGMVTGNLAESYPGRDDYYLHYYIYGENKNLNLGGGVLLDGYFEDGTPNNKYLDPQDAYAGGKGLFNCDELHMFDATYVQVREVSVGYSLPQRVFERIPISAARVSLVGRNLGFLYQKSPKGINPEASVTSGNGQGIEYGSLPPSSTYGINLNVSF